VLTFASPWRVSALASATLFASLAGLARADEPTSITNVGSDIVVYRIQQPNVRQKVTVYPSVVFQPGDAVTISAGGCVQTGGFGSTWKRYVDPTGDKSDRFYHGNIWIPGNPMTRILEVVGRTLTASRRAWPPMPMYLELGYDDDKYSDNGYDAHDDGNDNQCKDVGPAWVVLVVRHTTPTIAGSMTPIPVVSGITGPPILTVDYQNPNYDTSSQGWSSRVCNGTQWLTAEDPPYEWTPVYRPRDVWNSDSTALSGLAVYPPQMIARGGISTSDMPFTHPFGGTNGVGGGGVDWETYVALDSAFAALLAPSNSGSAAAGGDPNGEYAQAVAHASHDLGLSLNGVLGTETDQFLVPLQYRTKEGDRVAELGRWIVDCGHPDFHTEMHPPLLFVRAQAITAGSNPDAPTTGAPSVTFTRIIGRPFLVSQDFRDGGLFHHFINEGLKALNPFLSTRIEAHPFIFPLPFIGQHFFSYIVRAPIQDPSTASGHSMQLRTSFHFTTRSGVIVSVTRASAESVRISIAMNAAAYRQAPLPVRHDVSISVNALINAAPENGKLLLNAFKYASPFLNPFVDRGFLTDVYNAPIPASTRDGEITDIAVDALNGGFQYSIDDDQPFPIYGWLRLEWQPRS
jgi:hypothetical protein